MFSLPPIPPMHEIVDALKYLVAPPLFVSLGLAILRYCPPTVVLAVTFAAAVAAGNASRKPVPWLPEAFTRTGSAQVQTFEEKLKDSRGRDHLLWAAAVPLIVATAVEAAAAPWWLGWPLRIAACFAGAWLLTPVREDSLYLGAAVAVNWILLHRLGSTRHPLFLPIYLVFPLGAAGVVSLYCHSLRFMDVAVIASCAIAGTIPVLFWKKTKPTVFAAPAAILLPGLMLICKSDTFSEVPPLAMALVGLSPFGLLLFAFVGQRSRWWMWLIGASLAAAPLIAGLVMTMRAETVTFE